jgi:hypothetical protein
LINEIENNNNTNNINFIKNKNIYLGYNKKNNLIKSSDSPLTDINKRTNLHHNNCQYYYYDTVNQNLVDINSIDEFTNKYTMESPLNSLKLTYPLSFIDAVNKKQLDIENGLFKDPQSGTFNLRLNDALQSNLLDARSAYFFDSTFNRTYDLNDAFRNGLLSHTNRGTIVLGSSFSSHQSQSLSEALKSGYLKIGQPIYTQHDSVNNNNSKSMTHSVTSETQSMSVRSILDPSTGEFLMPTEAIKRKILDPYKGLFNHPVNGESLPISDAIQKGFVIVEILVDAPSTLKKITNNDNLNINRDSNSGSIISTSLIRETKSYHLLGVFDPNKNDEVIFLLNFLIFFN